jgi:hypothetical protein
MQVNYASHPLSGPTNTVTSTMLSGAQVYSTKRDAVVLVPMNVTLFTMRSLMTEAS